MKANFIDAVKQLALLKGIPESSVMDVIEESMEKAYQKKFKTTDNLITVIDEENSSIQLFARKDVVEDTVLSNAVEQITLTEAQRYNSDLKVGDTVDVELDPSEFGRIAAMAAKQIVTQRLRSLERDFIYEELKAKRGQIVSGIVRRKQHKTMFVDLGKLEGILRVNDQSPREHYSIGDRIKVIIMNVELDKRGVMVRLSRSHSDFVKKLFEMEVPEIYDHVVEIMGIAREAGYRTKVAVTSNKDGVDPVGACVGMKGIRIQSIVRELEGEKIDIVKWDDDIRLLVTNLLSPAKVTQVYANPEDKSALVVVPDDQQSLAIGKNGQNARLAAKLSTWKVDVKSEEEYRTMISSDESREEFIKLFGDVPAGKISVDIPAQEDEKAVKETTSEPETDYTEETISYETDETFTLDDLDGLTPLEIRKLKAGGYDDIEKLLEATKDELTAIPGIGKKIASHILTVLKENVEVIDDDDEYEGSEEETEKSEAE